MCLRTKLVLVMPAFYFLHLISLEALSIVFRKLLLRRATMYLLKFLTNAYGGRQQHEIVR